MEPRISVTTACQKFFTIVTSNVVDLDLPKKIVTSSVLFGQLLISTFKDGAAESLSHKQHL